MAWKADVGSLVVRLQTKNQWGGVAMWDLRDWREAFGRIAERNKPRLHQETTRGNTVSYTTPQNGVIHNTKNGGTGGV